MLYTSTGIKKYTSWKVPMKARNPFVLEGFRSCLPFSPDAQTLFEWFYMAKNIVAEVGNLRYCWNDADLSCAPHCPLLIKREHDQQGLTPATGKESMPHLASRRPNGLDFSVCNVATSGGPSAWSFKVDIPLLLRIFGIGNQVQWGVMSTAGAIDTSIFKVSSIFRGKQEISN